MRNHEYLALIRPGMDGLLVHFMLYADEIRENENKVGKDIEIRPKEVQLAKQLIENLSEPFEPDRFHDEYVSKLEEMIEAKIKGRKLTVVTPKARPKVVDLMDALQKSVQQTKRPVARAGNEQRSTRLKKVK
jgi:DNA end-binding protein Ku